MNDTNPTLTQVGQHAAPMEIDVLGKVIGDFRLIRQVGRGGMGIVYEAEQVSLNRRVALKVLPTASAMDGRQLRRFRNEAQAAANLHHTHIVPVFAVGQDKDVHFYAMQFIDGRSLADVIRDMARQARRGHEPVPAPHTISQTTPDTADFAGGGTRDTSHATLTADGSSTTSGFFRTVAHLGIEAAEALQHAHEMGVLHRDIKPANLMLESATGSPGGYRLWVTDFGLAQMADQPGMTMTGDLLGTMRYMSPEQALAKRAPVDHRTDIYSLGVTLYELLTLQPAFGGDDRREVLLAITTKEPTPPRKINPSVPRDLETIVLKSMSKSPSERYATAQELADDLQNFLHSRLISARRPTLTQKTRKWAWRHRVPVSIAAIGLLLTLTVGGAALGYIVRDRQAREAAYTDALERDLPAIRELMAKKKWGEARGVLIRLEAFLASRPAGAPHDKQIEAAHKELDTVETLRAIYEWEYVPDASLRKEEPNALMFTSKYTGLTHRWKLSYYGYRRAFAGLGLDVETGDPEETAKAIRASPIREELIHGLDAWAYVGAMVEEAVLRATDHNRFLVIANEADDDATRRRVRRYILESEPDELAAQASRMGQEELSDPSLVGRLAYRLTNEGQSEHAVSLMERAIEINPGDFNMRAWCIVTRLRQIGTITLGDQPDFTLTMTLLDDARAHGEAVVALKPWNADAYELQGWIAETSLRIPEAKESEPYRALRERFIRTAKERFDHSLGCRGYIAAILMYSGQAKEAIEILEAILTMPESYELRYQVDDRYLLACAYAIQVADPSADAQESIRYADLAIENLHRAVEAGYEDVEHIERDPDFNGIRDRDDFKQLVADMRAKANSP